MVQLVHFALFKLIVLGDEFLLKNFAETDRRESVLITDPYCSGRRQANKRLQHQFQIHMHNDCSDFLWQQLITLVGRVLDAHRGPATCPRRQFILARVSCKLFPLCADELKLDLCQWQRKNSARMHFSFTSDNNTYASVLIITIKENFIKEGTAGQAGLSPLSSKARGSINLNPHRAVLHLKTLINLFCSTINKLWLWSTA